METIKKILTNRLMKYILKRLIIAVPTLLVISFVVFIIIQLPPGSFLDTKLRFLVV